jgi:Fe2+ or Zn2+ uptake regulation protein
VARKYGFDVQAHKHELYGRCAECQRKKTRR